MYPTVRSYPTALIGLDTSVYALLADTGPSLTTIVGGLGTAVVTIGWGIGLATSSRRLRSGRSEIQRLLSPPPKFLDVPTQATLEDRLDELSESMRQSARLVEQVSAELDARAATARRLQEEAKNAEALAALHKDQADAIRRMIDAQLAAAAKDQEEANRRELAEVTHRIRSDSIKIGIMSFVLGGTVTFFVTLLVHPLHW